MGMNRLDPDFCWSLFCAAKALRIFQAFKGLIEDDFLKRDASCI